MIKSQYFKGIDDQAFSIGVAIAFQSLLDLVAKPNYYSDKRKKNEDVLLFLLKVLKKSMFLVFIFPQIKLFSLLLSHETLDES